MIQILGYPPIGKYAEFLFNITYFPGPIPFEPLGEQVNAEDTFELQVSGPDPKSSLMRILEAGGLASLYLIVTV